MSVSRRLREGPLFSLLLRRFLHRDAVLDLRPVHFDEVALQHLLVHLALPAEPIASAGRLRRGHLLLVLVQPAGLRVGHVSHLLDGDDLWRQRRLVSHPLRKRAVFGRWEPSQHVALQVQDDLPACDDLLAPGRQVLRDLVPELLGVAERVAVQAYRRDVDAALAERGDEAERRLAIQAVVRQVHVLHVGQRLQDLDQGLRAHAIHRALGEVQDAQAGAGVRDDPQHALGGRLARADQLQHAQRRPVL
mmetsp:Transcript_59173/g.163755  ORF Transcript_59173/g.163755 Transcript_59173/m.163755 type:complete len:248 (-) Transcript_59173:151-894(-)